MCCLESLEGPYFQQEWTEVFQGCLLTSVVSWVLWTHFSAPFLSHGLENPTSPSITLWSPGKGPFADVSGKKKSSFLTSYCKTMISVNSSLLALMWLLTWCITSPGPTPTEFTPPGNFSLYFDPNHSVSSVRNVCVSPSKLQIYRSCTLSYLPLYP